MRDAESAAYRPERAAQRRWFERAAAGYDAADLLQADVREELLARLDLVALEPRVVVDLGAATGRASRALKARYPRARVIAVDNAAAMLRIAGRRLGWWRRFDRICADIERLPFADASVDLLFCNLALAGGEPDAALAEGRRVLRAGGLLCLASLGPDTLGELRAAWARADDFAHVHRFADVHDLGDALVRAGFADPVLDVERRTVTYADLDGLVADLRASGARNALAGRSHGLTGKGAARALRGAYEACRREGRLPATCEIVFAHAWAPTAGAARARAHGGDATIAFEDFKRGLARRPPR